MKYPGRILMLLVKCGSRLPVFILLTGIPSSIEAQSSRPNLEGMWSDPPPTAVGEFCAGWCTDAGIVYLNKLLDDPAPVVIKRIRRWAPEAEIAPYVDCERPTEFEREVRP